MTSIIDFVQCYVKYVTHTVHSVTAGASRSRADADVKAPQIE